MQRNYQSNYAYSQYNQDLTQQTAFHEAGHAASIYLGNKLKQLPPVFFKIQISKPCDSGKQLFAKVIDGRLIQNLPITGLKNIHQLTDEEQLNYQTAYEADVINLLVGPLAEAKYVSIRDNEALNFNLLNPHALNYYGGSSDVEKAYSYLEYFIPSKELREEKMLMLFSQAFQFIEHNENWKCILNLAHYILESEKESISCEEAIDVLKRCLT
ncbi:MAG: hypothetical protein GQ532_04080 [Methylomarinum sp.]|nr:hypothetical protein [Methylomarinum sp.]